MSFVETQSGASVLAQITGKTEIAANLSIPIQPAMSATITGETAISGNLTIPTFLEMSATIAGETAIVAPLSLPLAMSATITGETAIDANLAAVFGFAMIATVVCETDISANLTQTEVDADEFILLLDIFAPDAPGAKTYSARITADGADVPIKSYAYNAPTDAAGASVSAALAFAPDRSIIESADDFRFDVFDNGTWKTLFDLGKRSANSFSFSYNGNSADFSTVSPMADKLEKIPLNDLIIYDSTRETLDADDFQIVYDSTGAIYSQQLNRQPGLDLLRLFNLVFVEQCGFSAVKTTIKNFPVRRADFTKKQSYLAGVAGHIGAFRPLLTIIGDTLWILDTTLAVPAGFPPPVTVTAGEYETATFSRAETNLDGYIVQYAVNEFDGDFYEPDETVKTFESGRFGTESFRTTTTTTKLRHWKKNSNPDEIIRTDIESIKTVVKNSFFQIVSEDTETREYDSFRRVKSTFSEIQALVPDLTVAPGTPAYGQLALLPVEEITTRMTYAPDRFDTTKKVLRRVVREKKSYIAIDAENQYISSNGFDNAEDFRQNFFVAMKAGNLRDGMTSAFARTETVEQTIEQLPNGQTQTKTIVHDILRGVSTPPTLESYAAGDISTNAQTSETREFIVLRPGAARTNRKLEDLPVAEIPRKIWHPLAERLLLQQGKKTGNVVLFGVRLDMPRGQIIDLYNQAGESVGVFIVEGLSIAASDLGTKNQKTRTQIDVREI